MRLRTALVSTLIALACAAVAAAQPPQPQQPQQPNRDVYVSPDAPKDQHGDVTTAEEFRKFEEAIKPHVKKARETYPEARKRFLDGLPPKHSFFVTARLSDREGHVEQVFIAVKEIKKGVIKGVIWNDIRLVSGYRHGDVYSFPEGELLDWTITRPDGTEEGNFVGKFLDTYRPE